MIFDELNLPVHFLDGGDTCANVGRIAVLTGDWESFWERFPLIFVDNKLIRHPTQKWHDECGSDQYDCIILALLLCDARITLQIIYDNYKRNYFRSNNGDLPRLHHLSIWGRFHSNDFAYYLGDIFIFLFVLFRRLAWSIAPGSVSNDVNLELMIRVFLKVKPTFLIRLARKIYKSRSAICTYFWADPNGRSDLAKYMLELYEK